MRRGLTLIELVFTMVIVAVVFTVIPKLIQTFGKTGEVAIKEDALFNAVSHLAVILAHPWDVSNATLSPNIATVNAGASRFACQPDGYRIGGFVGGRQCGLTPASASAILNGPPFRSIGDFNNVAIETFEQCAPSLYELQTAIDHVDDDAPATPVVDTSNTKRIRVQVNYAAGFTRAQGCITRLETHSYNIGLATINSRTW